MDHAIDGEISHLGIRLIRRYDEVNIVCLQRLQDTEFILDFHQGIVTFLGHVIPCLREASSVHC